MKNRLDKNSKLPSGKSKDASPEARPKGKGAKAAPPASEKKGKSQEPEPKAEEKTSRSGKSSKTPSQANREFTAPVSKRPAAGKTTARARGKAGSSDLEELSLEEFAISLIKPGETKERIWRTKSFQQHPAQREFGFPDVAPELPGQYSQSKLVLMPKDPECEDDPAPDVSCRNVSVDQKRRLMPV